MKTVTTVENELLKSRFAGAMVGSALGDAIGERRGHRAALANAEGLQDAWAEGILQYTDDTTMAIGLAESLVLKHDMDERTLGDRFQARFFEEPWRGYAGGPPKIFKEMRRTGSHDYYRVAKQMGESLFPGGSYGNGAAMRVSPLVFYYDSEDLYNKVEAQSRITHTHSIAIDGAAVLTRLLAISLVAGMAPEAKPFDHALTCDELFKFSRNEVMKDKLLRVRKCLQDGTRPEQAARILGQSVATHESVPFAIFSFFRFPGSFADCLFCATGNGGDVDTVGAMACAISGAYLGVDAIPLDWRSRLENARYIGQLAAWLCQIKSGQKPEADELIKLLSAGPSLSIEPLPGSQQ